MTKKIDYPIIKKMAFEAFRVFFLSAGAVVTAQISAGINILDWKNALVTLAISAAVAGLKAVGKWLRDAYGQGNYQSFWYQLPL